VVTVEIIVRLFLRHKKKRVEFHFSFSSKVVHSLEVVVFVEYCFEETLIFIYLNFGFVTQPNRLLQILLFVFNYIFSHFFSICFLFGFVNFLLFFRIVAFNGNTFTGVFFSRNFLCDLFCDLEINGKSDEF
jgi:hypothetical protein